MPQNITKVSDYTGMLHLVIDENTTDFFNEFAFEIEKKILRGDGRMDYGLLGDVEYIALLADLDSGNVPQTQKYTDLVDGINYIGSDGKTTIFGGIKKMLQYFIYCEFTKDNMYQESELGTLQTTAEHSIKTTRKGINKRANQRWNTGVDLYNGETYDYLLFYQSNYANWDFTRQTKYLTNGII